MVFVLDQEDLSIGDSAPLCPRCQGLLTVAPAAPSAGAPSDLATVGPGRVAAEPIWPPDPPPDPAAERRADLPFAPTGPAPEPRGPGPAPPAAGSPPASVPRRPGGVPPGLVGPRARPAVETRYVSISGRQPSRPGASRVSGVPDKARPRSAESVRTTKPRPAPGPAAGGGARPPTDASIFFKTWGWKLLIGGGLVAVLVFFLVRPGKPGDRKRVELDRQASPGRARSHGQDAPRVLGTEAATSARPPPPLDRAPLPPSEPAAAKKARGAAKLPLPPGSDLDPLSAPKGGAARRARTASPLTSLRRSGKSLRALKELMLRYQGNRLPPQVLLGRAEIAAAKGKPDAARGYYEAVIARTRPTDPLHRRALRGLGALAGRSAAKSSRTAGP